MRTKRRDTKKWAREHEQAQKRLAEFIAEHRGQRSATYWYDFQLPTLAGPLWVKMDAEWKTIFTRFDFPDRSRSLGIDCNPYTGKWNFHGDDHDAIIDEFSRRINPYLVSREEPMTDSYTRPQERTPYPFEGESA